MKSFRYRSFLGLVVLLAAQEARAESSVWVIRGPSSTVYLAGSCHVLRASDYPLPPEFDAAYRDSAGLVFEAPLDDMQTPEVTARLMRMASYDDGGTLQSHLAPEAYAKVESFCARRNYTIAQFQNLRPWMLAMTLSMMELQRLGIDPANGVDVVLGGKGKMDGKSIGSLESVDDQLGFLSLMDSQMDNEQVLQAVDELDQLGTEMPLLLKAWRDGDDQGLEQFILKEFKELPKLYQSLIVDRNEKWTGKIKEFLGRPGDTMVIVGAAHLIGDEGVVAKLRKDGLKVEKLHLEP